MSMERRRRRKLWKKVSHPNSYVINTIPYIRRHTSGLILGKLRISYVDRLLINSCQIWLLWPDIDTLAYQVRLIIIAADLISQYDRIAQGIYLNLQNNGYLEKQNKEQTYCEGCQKYGQFFIVFISELIARRFLADRFVEGTCPHCGYAVRFPMLPIKLV